MDVYILINAKKQIWKEYTKGIIVYFLEEDNNSGGSGDLYKIMPPKDVHDLVPRTCEYVELLAKGD